MPRRKTYRRKRTRRGKKRLMRRRGKGRSKPFSLTIRRPSCLPDRLFVKLKYTQLSYVVANAQPHTSMLFRGNSPWDPDYQLGGHSALGYDQWASLYHNYRVHKSHIFIRTASASQAFKMSVVPTSIPVMPLNINTAYEYPYAKVKTVSTTVSPDCKMSSYMYTKRIWGLRSIEYEDNCQAQVDAVPNNQWYWKLFFSSFDGTTNMTLHMDIMLVYYVEFFNRIELSQSGTLTNAPHGETGTQDVYYTHTQIGSTGSTIGIGATGIGLDT